MQPAVEKRRAGNSRFATEKQCFADREGRHQQPVLMDEMDAELLGKMRRQLVEGCAFDLDAGLHPAWCKSGQQLDQRRFAGAVLADEAMNRAAAYGERGTGKRLRAAEALDDAIEVNDVGHLRLCVHSRRWGYGHCHRSKRRCGAMRP